MLNIKTEEASDLVTQLVYTEIRTIIDRLNYGPDLTTDADELEVYKENFPEVYADVNEALYCEQHDI